MTQDFSDPDCRRNLLSLFSPGNGVAPPELAGREQPMNKLEHHLQRLARQSPPPADAVLYGPRGNGKTVLLGAFREHCRETDVNVISLRPDDIGNQADLAARLLYRDDDLPGRLLDSVRPDALRFNLPGIGGADWKRLDPGEKDRFCARHLPGLLQARCRDKPLVVTLDEAHTLDNNVGKRLLNVSEVVRNEGAPFLLVMAGTPNLRRRLGRMNASFWNRAEKLGIGRLTPAATGSALAKPLADLGIDIEPEALTAVVADSQCYPYFIQVWGRALCQAMVADKTFRVSPDIVRRARPEVEEQRADYYVDRYREMQDADLLPAAVALGRLYAAGSGEHDEQTIRQALQDAGAAPDETTAKRLVSELSDLGYLWQTPASTLWEPGIPSLVDYMLTTAPIHAGAG